MNTPIYTFRLAEGIRRQAEIEAEKEKITLSQWIQGAMLEKIKRKILNNDAT